MKFKKMFALSALVVALALLVAACAAPPTAAPAPTQAPAVQPTAAPVQPTAAPVQPTQPPAPAAVALKLWHGQTGAEADALNAAVAKFQGMNAGTTIELLAVPFDQLKNKFTTEASTGGGPDILIGPKDWIGEFAQASLVVSLDEMANEAGLNNLNKAAVDANKFQGKVWAFPESTEAVALWYNTDKVKTLPKDSAELLKFGEEMGLAVNSGFYHSLGTVAGFGGKLFDDKQVCVLDQGDGTVKALEWLKTAKGTKNVIVDGDGGKLDAAFKDGKVAFIFNGPWATGDYEKALGKGKVAVVPPISMVGGSTFAPFLGTKNLFVSANSKGDAKTAALKFLNFMSQPDTQAIFVAVGHIPSNPNTPIADDVLKGFLAQTQSATYFPNEPEMGAVWTPAGDMITTVLEGKATAADAAKAACATINQANKK